MDVLDGSLTKGKGSGLLYSIGYCIGASWSKNLLCLFNDLKIELFVLILLFKNEFLGVMKSEGLQT